jgi:hypothetical protein
MSAMTESALVFTSVAVVQIMQQTSAMGLIPRKQGRCLLGVLVRSLISVVRCLRGSH